MYFLNPIWLLALPVVLIVLPLVMTLAFRQTDLVRDRWGHPTLIDATSRKLTRRQRLARIAVTAAGACAIIVALARPAVDSGNAEFPQGTTDVIVLVDVSRSMAAVDYKGQMPDETLFPNGTRLDMARHLIMSKVVPGLGANRFGMVTYAGEAMPLAFLTQDVSSVDWVQRRVVTVSSAPGEGSALVKAFLLSFKMFDLDSEPGRRRVIILFSDGGNDDGLEDLNAVIREINERGIELVVVGLGKTTPSPIPLSELPQRDPARHQNGTYYTDNGQVQTTRLEENVLRLFSNRTGGKYVRVTDSSDFSFERLSQELDLKQRRGRKELFFFPMLAAFLLITAGWFLSEELRTRAEVNGLLRKFRRRGGSTDEQT